MNKSYKLVIIGLGETADLAYEYFTHDSPYDVVAFAVDEEFLSTNSFRGLPVIAINDVVEKYPPSKCCVFVAISSGELNRRRTKVYAAVKKLGYSCASYISSKAFVWHNVAIGENCFIMENNVLQPFTSIGNNVVMWSGNHLGHRSVIEDNVFVTSHVVISGFCKIGKNSFLGVNSCIADNTTIGRDNFIAMGACITRSTQDDEIYRGNPAMKVKASAKTFCGVLQ